MALLQLFTVLGLALAFSRIELSLGAVVKGSVLCSDCDPHYDFSGMKVLVKCEKVKNMRMATTDENGGFETKFPSNAPTSAAPNCLARLYGGPNQVYALKKDTVAKVVPSQGLKNTYTLLTSLAFSKSCPGKCVVSSKTIGLPDYGLPPNSFFPPVLPIIGIP